MKFRSKKFKNNKLYYKSKNMASEEHIRLILSQTTYSKEEAEKKYVEHNGDLLLVMREYLGIKPQVKNDKINVKALNQEIYRQIRSDMDKCMREYRNNNPIDMDHVANCLRESEERQNGKY
jgi:hypothetical protein